MRDSRVSLLALLVITVISVSGLLAVATAQGQSTALERGYRTGYSDGYNSGYKDVADGAERNFQNKQEYQSADRAYNQVWGPVEDYRDGYQQGFEAGYAAGFDRKSFDSTIPTGLRRRDAGATETVNSAPAPAPVTPDNTAGPVSAPATTTSGSILIPRDAILTVELMSNLSTDVSQRGDRFQTKVVLPAEYAGAIIDGRITNLKRPGKVKGVAELQLSFEQIRLPDGRSSSFRGEVVEVMSNGGDDTVGTVDPEGGVKGRDSTKDDVSKVGAATGIGAIIGAIAGGGKGAAIGAAIGGGVGTGGVMSQRGKDIRLTRGQQLRIRTATETQVP